jgi:phage FluMu gp28-like protein
MSAVITAPSIDRPVTESRYFLPYQKAWIEDENPMKLWEKSFRIGATWADAFANVRKRLHHAKRDYLFATKDYPSALEYMTACKQFCEIYDRTRSIVSHGEDIIKAPVVANGKSTGFTEDIKIGFIKFDNGSRIIAFSANPSAMLVYGGDVGLDEFPRHERAEELWAVAQARATWGYDIAVWGSHKGNTSLFYQFSREARAGKGGWSHHLTTIVDAVDQGLVEKINEVRGTKFTREGFLEDCRKRAKLPGIYEEAYMCNPQGGIDNIVPWSAILACQQTYEIARAHAGAKEVAQLFGEYRRESEKGRETKINAWMAQAFARLLAPKHRRLGFDIAASGQGDLGALYVDAKDGDRLRLDGLLTTRTEDWHFIRTACRWLMQLPSITGRGDETGLGKDTCWHMTQEFPGRFLGVNFSRSKADMGTLLMTQLSEHRKVMPDNHPDIPADFYALQKTIQGNKVIFHEGPNEFNDASHCDIAWAGALASQADKEGGGPFGFASVPRPQRAGRAAGL